MVTPDPKKELERLVELDYERTATFITGVTGTSSTVRGWAITIWLAVIGFAIDRGEWPFALTAALVSVAFYFVDAYHANLYSQALDHAAQLERVTGEYFGFLGRGDDDEDTEHDAAVALQSHKFGLYRSLRPFTLKDLRFARPAIFFRLFYGVMFVGALALAGFLWLASSATKPLCSVDYQPPDVHIVCPSPGFSNVASTPSPTVSPVPANQSSSFGPTPLKSPAPPIPSPSP